MTHHHDGPVVVGYNDEEPAQRALERAITEAQERGAKLVIVSVEAMPLDPEGPQNFGTLDDSPARMIPLVAPPELQETMNRALDQAEAAGVRTDSVWGAGDPARTIADAARERHASVVVLGAHHHSFMGRLFGTDVAAEVEHELGSDLVVVD
ncbi:MAG TPA: universal stress protein [Gaiellaceae bacterium]|nr:universal stress protein [Gaiellaceae bacterium]